MLTKLFEFLLISLFPLLPTQGVQDVGPQEKVLTDDKVKRYILSFLDPNSLGRLTYTKKSFCECVNQMDFFRESKRFLKTISEIKAVLSKIEFLVQNGAEIKIINYHESRLISLIDNLWSSAMVETKLIHINPDSDDSEDDEVDYNPKMSFLYYYPVYNPMFSGSRARSQALEKTIASKRAELQQLFIRMINIPLPLIADFNYRLPPIVDFDAHNNDLRITHCLHRDLISSIALSTLADFETIKTGINEIHAGLDCWVQNPNITQETYENFLGKWVSDWPFSECTSYLTQIFANPVTPEETVKEYFEKILETTVPNLETTVPDDEIEQELIEETRMAFATGVALNPIAISTIGDRLLKWLIQNEQSVLYTECGKHINHSRFIRHFYFPLRALILNLNLPKTTSKEVLDYLLSKLKQIAVPPTYAREESFWDRHRFWDFPEKSSRSNFFQSSEWDIFYELLIYFAKTAHGSEVILENLEAILLEPLFDLKLKVDLIQSLFEGFSWDYYFKNYNHDYDVKLPAALPGEPTLAILFWISKLPLADIPFQILNRMVSVGKLSPQAIDKVIDIMTENPNEEFKTQLLIKLIKKTSLHQGHRRRILMISTPFSDELKSQIQEAIGVINF